MVSYTKKINREEEGVAMLFNDDSRVLQALIQNDVDFFKSTPPGRAGTFRYMLENRYFTSDEIENMRRKAIIRWTEMEKENNEKKLMHAWQEEWSRVAMRGGASQSDFGLLLEPVRIDLKRHARKVKNVPLDYYGTDEEAPFGTRVQSDRWKKEANARAAKFASRTTLWHGSRQRQEPQQAPTMAPPPSLPILTSAPQGINLSDTSMIPSAGNPLPSQQYWNRGPRRPLAPLNPRAQQAHTRQPNLHPYVQTAYAPHNTQIYGNRSLSTYPSHSYNNGSGPSEKSTPF